MRTAIVLAGVLLLVLAVPAAAQRTRSAPLRLVPVERRVLSVDREEIQRYFARYRETLPPGLARRDPLPPGVVEHLMRGETLPPGLEGEIQTLPRALEVRLTALDVSLQRGYVDGRVLVWERKTRRLVEVIELS